MRPLCLGTSGSLRATSMHHFASWANVVQTFWPVIRQPPFILDGFGLQRCEVRARLGLREPLAPDLLRGEDRLQIALLLLLGAVGDDHRAAHHEPEDVGGSRRLGSSELLAEDRLLDQRGPSAAVLLWPRHAGPAGRSAACAATRARTRTGPGRRPGAPGRGGSPPARRAARRGTTARRLSASDPCGLGRPANRESIRPEPVPQHRVRPAAR